MSVLRLKSGNDFTKFSGSLCCSIQLFAGCNGLQITKKKVDLQCLCGIKAADEAILRQKHGECITFDRSGFTCGSVELQLRCP